MTKTLEETKSELTAISGKSCEQISSWDDLAKLIRLECVKAAEQVAKLEALHEQVLGVNSDELQPVLVASPLGSAGWVLDETGFVGKP